MGMMQEFKEFAMKGNVVDLAVGVIIGAAFGKIVASLVNDVIMPPIGMLLGGVDFKNLFFALKGGPFDTLEQAVASGMPIVKYGNFIQTVVDFLIVAFCIFLMVKQVTRCPARKPAAKQRARRKRSLRQVERRAQRFGERAAHDLRSEARGGERGAVLAERLEVGCAEPELGRRALRVLGAPRERIGGLRAFPLV